MTRREESITLGSSGDEPPLCPRQGTRVFSSLWFALPCSPLLTAPWPHTDPSPSPANRGRCQVSSLWDAEQHPHTPPTTRGKTSPASLQKQISGIFSCACFRKQFSNDMTYFPSIPSRTWITTTDTTTHPKIQPLLCPAVKMLQVPRWDQQCPARIPNPAPSSTHVGRGVVEHWLGGHIHLLLEKHPSQRGGQLELGGHLTEVTVLLLLPADGISSTAEPGCEGQRVHQQPVPGLLPLRNVALCPCLLMPVPALSPRVSLLSLHCHQPTWGPGDQAATLLWQCILRFFSQIWPCCSH